jgi:hypothetical protein
MRYIHVVGTVTVVVSRPSEEGEAEMTKKHFEWAADWLARDAANGTPADENAGARRFATALFETFNPRFDRGRFERRYAELLDAYDVKQ